MRIFSISTANVCLTIKKIFMVIKRTAIFVRDFCRFTVHVQKYAMSKDKCKPYLSHNPNTI